MAQVRAIRLCFIDNTLRQEGDEFEYNGPMNTNVEYLDGKPAVADEADEPDEAPAAPKKWQPRAKRGGGAVEGSV